MMFDLLNVKIDVGQIFRNALTTWKRAPAAIFSMPYVAFETFTVLIVLRLFYFYFYRAARHAGMLQPAGVTIYLIYLFQVTFDGLVFAPWGLAVERFFVFGEKATHFLSKSSTSRLFKFARLRAIANIIETIPQILIILTMRNGSHEMIMASFLTIIPAAWLLYRFYLLFPAIAVESSGSTFSSAHLDAKGSFWLSMVFIAITMSPLVVVILRTPSLSLGLAEGWTTFAKILVFRVVLETLWITVANAACAQLYILHSKALGRPCILTPTLLKVFE